tara:strand:- start:5134 stop:5889 length:756 start_codon:yes stop_codon:yes gene_type:complete
MINETKNNLFFVQFTPGAGGRFILVCCTTADNVGSWMPDPLPDPIEYTKSKFCVEQSILHMKTETQTPYDLFWFTRQYPFSRGDNLTQDEVTTHLMKDQRAVTDLNNDKLLASIWNKTYLPNWFEGKLLSIVSDDDSHAWLMQRRKEVFYKFENGKAYLMRYMPEGIHNGHMVKQFSDQPQTIFDYTNEDDFVEWDYHDKVSPGTGKNINLSDILYKDPDFIWDKIDNLLGSPINREWCTPALITWRQRWT